MTDGTSCPGCGAPIAGWRCEYCGREHPEYRREVKPWVNVAFNPTTIGMASLNNVYESYKYQKSAEMRNAMLAICMAGHRQPWKP